MEPTGTFLLTEVSTWSNKTVPPEIEGPTYLKTPRLIIAATITALVILCNLFTICLLRKSAAADSSRQDVLFLQSLFTSDLLSGLTTMTMAVLAGAFSAAKTWPMFTRVQFFFWNWTGCCSIYHIAAVSFVKLLAIIRPLHFEQDVTKLRCLVAMAMMWALSLVLSIPILTDYIVLAHIEPQMLSVVSIESQPYNLVLGFLVSFPASMTIFISYGKIFLVILKQKRTVNQGPQSDQVDTSPGSLVSALRSAKRMLIIIVLYFAIYCPAYLALSSGIIADPATRDEWYCFFIMWLMLSNGCINSVTYVVMYKETRAVARKMLGCWKDDGTVAIETQSINGGT